MKTNMISDATKILILAASTSITCVLVAVGFITLRSAQELNASAIEQMEELNHDLMDCDIKRYDNIDLYGSDVTNCIKKQLGDYDEGEIAPIYIYVKTNSSENTYYNGSQLNNIQSFSHANYIKPTVLFRGKIVENENDVIVGIQFTQQ